MILDDYMHIMQPAIEVELRKHFVAYIPEEFSSLRSMIAYHMGWEGEGAGPKTQGKRIRPLLILLCTEAAGGKWEDALPAAASVEFIHNFTLVHDDIEDDSQQRRGRPTLWVKWGIPQAINAGDLLHTLGFLAMNKLHEYLSSDLALRASQILQETCIRITEGQYLDLFFETQKSLPLESYWPMIEGKTSALLGCCTELGALIAKMDPNKLSAFNDFGRSLGLAFQVVDDWLGIWGDPILTGKPVGSDLLSGKKSLPVLFSLQKKGGFSERWNEKPIEVNEVAEITAWLREEGAEAYTLELAEKLTHDSITQLKKAVDGKNEAGLALEELIKLLVRRNK